eukprot:TRINITY_DN13632_c0_g1_i2.p1 TRINITY_DN13632_c0_g1~~TRINITY_DN13632_c0_g1_i2.p1  ORF type:complete len:607 (+),score=89.11 TRINITY_DN13632_c0_g1_i2:161-1981(+)
MTHVPGFGMLALLLLRVPASKLECPDGFEFHHKSRQTLKQVLTSMPGLASHQECCAICGMYDGCSAFTYDKRSGNCSVSLSSETERQDDTFHVFASREAPASLPDPPAPVAKPGNPPLGFQPNILLLFPDEWRFDWDGFNSDIPLKMPTLRKYASSGTRFKHAYVPAPLCAPSRACLASGREYDFSGVPGNTVDIPVNQSTFYKQLQRAGYHVMMTGKDDLTKKSQIGALTGRYKPFGGYRSAELGISDGIRTAGKDSVVKTWPLPHDEYGFMLQNATLQLPDGSSTTGWDSHYYCFIGNMTTCNKHTFPDELYQDDWTAANAMKLLDRKPNGKPWFLQVNFPGPHPPFLVTARMADSVADHDWGQPEDAKEEQSCKNSQTPGKPANGAAKSRCNYGAELENLDRLFGMIIDKVTALGELDKTLVFFSSDHGDLTGDHDGEGKSTPWQESASVPLVVFGGSSNLKVAAGRLAEEPTATLDLAATFIDYAGGELAESMTTRSLRPVLEGRADTVRPFVSSGLGNWRMAVQNIDGIRFKFVCGKGAIKYAPSTVPAPVDGWTQLLYNIDQDHFDMHDLSSAHPKVVHVMREYLPKSFACGQTESLILL